MAEHESDSVGVDHEAMCRLILSRFEDDVLLPLRYLQGRWLLVLVILLATNRNPASMNLNYLRVA